MSDKKQSFEDYLKALEEAPQPTPQTCSIDNDECEACGS